MRSLLEIRDMMKRIYARYEFVIVPVLKFMLAFVALSIVSGQMGYMYQLDNLGLVLIVSLMCSFLPNGFIVLFAALLSLAHMYALSLEVAIVGLAVYMILFLLFFRLGSGKYDSLILIFTGICAAMKIPYVIPIAVGLLATPGAIFAVATGLIGYYLLDHIIVNAQSIYSMSDAEAIAKIRLVIDGIITNKELLVMILAFAVTITVVYVIKRLSVDYSWTIAMIAGAILNLIILLIGDLMYDINISLLGAVFGSILAVGIGKVLEFLRFSVDYSRIENVQFEDDEYYYYVKAIPKMNVAAPAKTVKKINVQRQSAPGRSVTTERTGRTTSSRNQSERGASGRSVTIGNRASRKKEEVTEDFFEDWDE